MKFLRDPLLHFVVLGAALFAIYALATGLFSSNQARRIEIGNAEVEFLAANFERQWGRAPLPEEMQRLLDARVREEILYREALAVGLDRNDVVVRRRMVQKMELLTQDLALMTDPTEEELRAFLAERGDEYRIPPRLSFSQLYFNVDQRGVDAEPSARQLLAELREGGLSPDQAEQRGDSIMIERDYDRRTPDDVRRVFGERFAEALFELDAGWQGPVVSGYGLHLVHIGDRLEGRMPEYEEVRDRLIDDYNRVRRDRANASFYENLASRYEVSIDGQTAKVDPE